MIKRLFDIIFALFFILLFSPFFLIIPLLILVDSGGPVLFIQKRVGKNGRPFKLIKFRTMVQDAEKTGPVITAKKDPRVTQIGQVLRWMKLDELPNFFNVLKGEMSLIGPRPEVPKITALYTEKQKEVLSVKPGIIGPTQLTHHDEEEELPEQSKEVEDFYVRHLLKDKLESDLSYVEDKNPFKDIWILAEGVVKLLSHSAKVTYIFESRVRMAFFFFDLAAAAFSLWLAYELRFDGQIPANHAEQMIRLLPWVVLASTVCFIFFGLYQTLWQYLGASELVAIFKVSLGSALTIPFAGYIFDIGFIPRSIIAINALILFVSLGGARVLYKLSVERLKNLTSGKRKNVFILGAGDAGAFLVREFKKNASFGMQVAGFLDDDRHKHNSRIYGVKVLGPISKLSSLSKIKHVEEVILALPKLPPAKMRGIWKTCRQLGIACRIAPSSIGLVSPHVGPLKLRPVDVSDLLGRELVNIDHRGLKKFFESKKILVTGAGGSIGSEIVRTVLSYQPEEIILVDNTESNLYDIEMEMRDTQTATQIYAYLYDVTVREKMEKVFKKHRPDIVFHAAAFKHVPLVETYYDQGILNNVLGTKNVADLAGEYRADKFVLISTDKAVKPKSVMGATKRIGEMYIQSLKDQPTKFCAVRFGNVFNSRGSVVPLFKRQVEEGRPLTVTHEKMKRYFMDLSEAVLLVLEAGNLASGGEVFVLDMGQPVYIKDLAVDIAQLMGMRPEEIKINYIGIRPGEKLEEELTDEKEDLERTVVDKISVCKKMPINKGAIDQKIQELLSGVIAGESRETIIQKIKQTVPEFTN